MCSHKSVTPLIQTPAKKPSNLSKALSQLLLLVMLLNPIVTLRASASNTPQYASGAISQTTLSDIRNPPHPLDLESRMICRQAVEEVYWRHRIWPAENQSPKPDLEQVLPPQVLRAKVEDDLRRSNALAQLWQRPITGAQLQAEIDRMIKSTSQPQVLSEIFAALNNDPYLVAECLARPVLADRLIHSYYVTDQHSDQDFDRWWQTERSSLSQKIGSPDYAYHLSDPAQIVAQDDTWTPTPALPEGIVSSTAVWTGSEMIIWGGVGAGSGGRTDSGARYNPATDTWTTTTTIGAPSPRSRHTAVWTGSEMIVWGGCDQNTEFCDVNSGGRYNPLSDSWTSTDTSTAPVSRMNHTAVWTGSRMIIWAGCSVGSQGNNQCTIQRNDGGVYDPTSDTWQAMSTVGAPDAREYHRAVWANGVMVIWGGFNIGATNTGGRYNPVSNTWQPTSTAGAPAARANHSMVWTGSEAIVWGGCNISLCIPGYTFYNSGGRYNPVTDTWSAMNTADAPTARGNHSAIWSGTEMIVWGGHLNASDLNDGSRYDPANDSWTDISTTGAPSARSSHHAVWTGNEMIVWGGNSKTGGRYGPSSDTWVPTSTNDPVYAKERHTAVWTGTEMLIWGGSNLVGDFLGLGIRFDTVTGSWSLMSTTNEPFGRFFHTAVWTGSKMIVWGGQYGTTLFNEGGRYDPISDSWTNTSTSGAPSERANHVAVWTGSEMLIWGGNTYEGYANTGGRYDPDTNTWSAISTSGAPSGRAYIPGIWSGTEMIVWGGYTGSGDTNSGGRYNPQTNSWTDTSITNAPTGRHFNTAVWTGSEMIVWGGMSGNLDNGTWYNTGGRYNPTSNTWSATSMTDAPSPRIWHVDAWTGQELIVWGGCTGPTSCSNEVYTGGRYDPNSDSWSSTSIQSAPSERANSSAIWTGADMLVWGGLAGNVGTYTTTGGFYHVSYISNTPPSAVPDSYTTDEDVPLSVAFPGVLGNDVDEDGDPLTALLVSNPIHGSLVLASDGSFTYTPDGNFNGSDSFSYSATDGIAVSNIATVTITVTAVNDAPFFISSPVSGAMVGETYTYLVITGDPELPYGEVLTITAPILPGWLSLVDSGDGTATLLGTPGVADVGEHEVVLLVSDQGGLKATQTFTITVVGSSQRLWIYIPVVVKGGP